RLGVGPGAQPVGQRVPPDLEAPVAPDGLERRLARALAGAAQPRDDLGLEGRLRRDDAGRVAAQDRAQERRAAAVTPADEDRRRVERWLATQSEVRLRSLSGPASPQGCGLPAPGPRFYQGRSRRGDERSGARRTASAPAMGSSGIARRPTATTLRCDAVRSCGQSQTMTAMTTATDATTSASTARGCDVSPVTAAFRPRASRPTAGTRRSEERCDAT